MSYIVDDKEQELSTNELLLLIFKQLQIMNLHLQNSTDIDFQLDDTNDQPGE
jgi:hypothetical protein